MWKVELVMAVPIAKAKALQGTYLGTLRIRPSQAYIILNSLLLSDGVS